MVRLRGMAWQHRRAMDPLTETAAGFCASHPGIEIEWSSRSLAGFEFQPVEELARSYDLIVVDHPFVGAAVRKGSLLQLNSLLSGCDADYIGPSLATYNYNGAIYAVPVDAACQVSVYRPDLMGKVDMPLPQTWSDVLKLGEAAARKELKLGIALSGVHSLMTFFTLMAELGIPCAQTPAEPFCDRPTAREALALLRGLLKFCPPQVFDWNSIQLHEMLVRNDHLAYCPAVYCYATYAESDMPRPLRFDNLPGTFGPSPRGSTIGGTGLAVSAESREPEVALAYAAYAASLATQRKFAQHHGQPARAEIWHDAQIDEIFGGCFSNTRTTLENSWIRPRYAGYLEFQKQGGILVEHHLRGEFGEVDLLAKLEGAFLNSAALL